MAFSQSRTAPILSDGPVECPWGRVFRLPLVPPWSGNKQGSNIAAAMSMKITVLRCETRNLILSGSDTSDTENSDK
jgi:hypothetical protein